MTDLKPIGIICLNEKGERVFFPVGGAPVPKPEPGNVVKAPNPESIEETEEEEYKRRDWSADGVLGRIRAKASDKLPKNPLT